MTHQSAQSYVRFGTSLLHISFDLSYVRFGTSLLHMGSHSE